MRITVGKLCCSIAFLWLPAVGFSQSNVIITGFSPNGLLTCSNVVQNSTCRVEWAPSLLGPWTNSWAGLTNIAVGTNTRFSVPVPMFYRVVMTPPPPPNTNIYTIGWCQFHWPLSPMGSLTNLGFSVYGWVYIAGLTDRNPTNDPAPNVVAQAGYGPPNTAPANNTNWTWVTAVPNPNYPGNSNDDEYRATLTIPRAGSYHGVFRFSGNAGQTWQYGGTTGSTSANGTTPMTDPAYITIGP